MNLVDLLLLYIETFDKDLLIKSEICIEDSILLVICDELLSWLKLEYKRTMWINQGRRIRLKPLQLNLEYTWCRDLISLIEQEELFRNHFQMNSNLLQLSSQLDEKTKEFLREMAYAKYNPYRDKNVRIVDKIGIL